MVYVLLLPEGVCVTWYTFENGVTRILGLSLGGVGLPLALSMSGLDNGGSIVVEFGCHISARKKYGF